MRIIELAGTLIMTMTIAGCANKQPEVPLTSPSSVMAATDYKYPADMGPMTTVWQAGPGVNLTSPEATVVRAYFESQFIQSFGQEEYVWPGYIKAMGVRYETETFSHKFTSFGGTRRMLLHSVRSVGDVVYGQVCDDSAGLYRLNRNGSTDIPISPSGAEAGSDGHLYMEEPYADSVKLLSFSPHNYPLEVAQGSARAPNWNAFEGWKILGRAPYDVSFDSAPVCQNWATSNYPGIIDPGPPPRRMYPNSVPDPEFQPTLPQYPGWTRR